MERPLPSTGWLPPLLVGALLRSTHLRARPIWHDELITWQASQSLSFETWIGDLHPPTFSIIVALLAPLGPLLALRLPSFLAGCASILVARSAGRAWGGPRVGAICAWACACASPWVAYAQEGRPYAWAGLAMWALLWLLGRKRTPATGLLVGLLCAVWSWSGMAAALCWIGVAALEPRRRRTASWAALGWALVSLPLVFLYLGPQMAALTAPPAHHALVWSTPFPLFEFLGWTLLGPVTTGRTLVGGVFAALLLAGVAHHKRTPAPLMAAVSIAGFAVAHGLELHPFGATRQCLVLTPITILVAGLIADEWWRPRWRFAGYLAIAVAGNLSIAVAPGVPVVDVPALIASLPKDHVKVWVDPRIVPAWKHYGGEMDFTGTWKTPDPPPHRPLRVVIPSASGSPTPHSSTITATGVVAELYTAP